MTDRDLTDKIRVEKIAKAKGISMAQLSLAWIMSQKGIFSLLLSFLPVVFYLNDKYLGVSAPIVRTTSLENLYDLLGLVYFQSSFLRNSNSCGNFFK